MPYLARKNAITLIEEAIRDFRYFYGTLPPRARRTYEGTLFSEGAARLTAAVEKEGFRNMLPALDSAGFEIVYKTFYILAKNLNLAAYEAFNRQDLITLENLQAALGALHRDSEVDDVLRGFSTAELASLPFSDRFRLLERIFNQIGVFYLSEGEILKILYTFNYSGEQGQCIKLLGSAENDILDGLIRRINGSEREKLFTVFLSYVRTGESVFPARPNDMPASLTGQFTAQYIQKKVHIYEWVSGVEGNLESLPRWTVEPLTLVGYQPHQTVHTVPAFFLVDKGAAAKALGEAFFHRINREEINLIKEILGVDADPDIKIMFLEHFMDRAISLPLIKLIIIDRQRTPIMASSYNKGNFLHEYFHQIEYKTIDHAFRDLALKEFFMPDETAYAPGSYDDATLSGYYNLDAIATMEGKAQLVGEFTEFYTDLTGSLADPDKREALKEQARILFNSGYNSIAITTIMRTIR